MLTGVKAVALTLLLPLALPGLAIAIPSRFNSTIPKYIRVRDLVAGDEVTASAPFVKVSEESLRN